MSPAARTPREAALKSAEDALFEVRRSFELADTHRLNGGWIAERSAVEATREAITQTVEHLTTLRGML